MQKAEGKAEVTAQHTPNMILMFNGGNMVTAKKCRDYFVGKIC